MKAFYVDKIESTNGADTDKHLYRLESGEYVETYGYRVGGKPVTAVWESDDAGRFRNNDSRNTLIHWAEGVTDTKEAMRQAGYDVD